MVENDPTTETPAEKPEPQTPAEYREALESQVREFLATHTVGKEGRTVLAPDVTAEMFAPILGLATKLGYTRFGMRHAAGSDGCFSIASARAGEQRKFAFPLSVDSMVFVRLLREWAHEYCRLPRTLFDGASDRVRGFVGLIDQELPLSGSLIASAKFVPPTMDGGLAYRIRLRTRSARMPKGTVPPMASSSLVGQTIGDPLALAEQFGACQEGIRNFFDRHVIEYDAGPAECAECGQVDYENPDSCGDIVSVESFDLTEEMIDAIDRAGYLDELREHFGLVPGSGEGWKELLNDNSVHADLVEALVGNGPKDDHATLPDGCTFQPDVSLLEGIDDLEAEDAIRLGSALSDVVRTYVDKRKLPPVPGEVTVTDPQSTAPDSVWRWDPETGEMASGVLRYYVTDGRYQFVLQTPYGTHRYSAMPWTGPFDTTYDVAVGFTTYDVVVGFGRDDLSHLSAQIMDCADAHVLWES